MQFWQRQSRLSSALLGFLSLLGLLWMQPGFGAKIYKWVDDKGQTHFTSTPPNLTDTVPLKSYPGDAVLKERLKRGIWWAKEGNATIRVLFKEDHVVFDSFNLRKGNFVSQPLIVAAYEVVAGKILMTYNFHQEKNLRGSVGEWSTYEPKENFLMLTNEGRSVDKKRWVLRRLKFQSNHPVGVLQGTWRCKQRPRELLKIGQGVYQWINNKNGGLQGGYVKWMPPVMQVDMVFDLSDPIDPYLEKLLNIEVLNNDQNRLILQYPNNKVLVCASIKK